MKRSRRILFTKVFSILQALMEQLFPTFRFSHAISTVSEVPPIPELYSTVSIEHSPVVESGLFSGKVLDNGMVLGK